MKTIAAAICAALAAFTLAADTGKQTFRDSMGRTQGTATTDKSGKTTYRDAMGRVQATSK